MLETSRNGSFGAGAETNRTDQTFSCMMELGLS